MCVGEHCGSNGNFKRKGDLGDTWNIGVIVGTSKERETWVIQVMGEH